MQLAYVIAAGATVALNIAIVAADFARAPFVLANSAEVQVPRTWLPWLAACKAAGAAGILVGVLADLPGFVIAASLGLVLFYLGAIGFHIRARVLYNVGFPGVYLTAASATLVFAIGQVG